MLGFGLLRFSVKMTFFVVTARWMYAEAEMVAPGVLPLIDAALHHVAIPTHDTWGRHFESVRELALNLSAEYPELLAKISTPPDSERLQPVDLDHSSASPRGGLVLGVVSDSLKNASVELDRTRL